VEEQVTREWSSGPARLLLPGPHDFERYPEWAADIKAVAIDERDADGRAVQVTYRAAAFGRSTSYTLRYDYSDAPTRLSWEQVSGTSRAASTAATTSTRATRVCRRHLSPGGRLESPLPVFVKRRAEGRITYTALKELKARARSDRRQRRGERGGPRRGPLCR